MSAHCEEVRCSLEIARTADELHAHLELDGIEVQPGDTVLLLDAPAPVAQGERLSQSGRASVRRAGTLGRAWARLGGLLSLADLVEVSFSPHSRHML